MTVSNLNVRSGPYTANDVTTVFAFDFKVFEEDHLLVTTTVDDEVFVTIDPVNYTVAGLNDDAGGTVTFTTAPVTGLKVYVERTMPFLQETDLENQGVYYAADIEKTFDLSRMHDIELLDQVGRALKLVVGLLPISILEILDEGHVYVANVDGDLVDGGQITGVDKATASDIRAGVADKYVTADGIESAAAFVTLTDAATVAVDWETFINASVTLGGNRTMGLPSNGEAGTVRLLHIIQDATGSRTVTWNAAYKFAGGVAPTLSTDGLAIDVFTIQCIDAANFHVFPAGLDMS